MRIFLKYFFLGILGLALTVAFPHLKINWLVVVVGLVFLESGAALALILSAALALAYSAFTLANPVLVVIPLAVGMAVFHLLKSHFFFNAMLSRFWVLVCLWLSDWLFWDLNLSFQIKSFSFSFQNWWWGFATIVIGVWIVPYLARKLSRVLKRFSLIKKTTGELDYFQGRRNKKGILKDRKPFWFGEGI